MTYAGNTYCDKCKQNVDIESLDNGKTYECMFCGTIFQGSFEMNTGQVSDSVDEGLTHNIAEFMQTNNIKGKVKNVKITFQVFQ